MIWLKLVAGILGVADDKAFLKVKKIPLGDMCVWDGDCGSLIIAVSVLAFFGI